MSYKSIIDGLTNRSRHRKPKSPIELLRLVRIKVVSDCLVGDFQSQKVQNSACLLLIQI